MPDTRCSTPETSAVLQDLNTTVPPADKTRRGEITEEDVSTKEAGISGNAGTTPRTMCGDKSPPMNCSEFTSRIKVEDSDLESYEVAWVPGELENPQNRALASKRIITIGCCMMVFDVAFASSAPSMASAAIAHEFDASGAMSAWVTSLFLCGYIAGPLLWGPLSELIGRQPVVLGTFGAFILFQLGAALKIGLPALLISRALAGFFASGPLTNSGAVISDIWDSARRVQALSWQVTMPFLGTTLGPVIGSTINESCLGYRWIFWSLMMLSGATWFLLLFTMPETYSPILLVKKAKMLRETTGDMKFYAPHEKANCTVQGVLQRTLFRPIEMMMTEPILILIVMYISTISGLLYSLLEAFPIIWQDIRGFNSHATSMILTGVGLGSVLGRFVQLYLAHPMIKLMPKWHGHPPCEMNLYGAMVAGPFLISGVFWLGWTGAYAHIPWWVPALPTIFIGMSFNLAFISLQCYLVNVYLTYAASALAASMICRAIVGAVVPLFTRHMYIGLGTQWACTLAGFFSLIISFLPFIFYKYGSKLRAKSKFSVALDLQMKERVKAEGENQESGPAASESSREVHMAV